MRATTWMAVCLAVFGLSCSRNLTFVTIGTGGVTGVYYPAGGAIAQLVNRAQAEHGVRASVESTGGSVYNLNAVLSGDLTFGIAQSDKHYQAWNGEAEWEGRPQQELRSVFSLHPEVVTLVAADDSGIQSIKDFKGKRINIGNPGSGQRGNAIDVITAAGLDWETDFQAEGLKPAEAPRMVQDGRIDAFFYTVGHPNGNITEATAGRRKVHFVSITGMEALIAASPYYAPAKIPGGLYPMATNETDVESIGVVTTFVTSSATPEAVVYAVVKEVFENLEEFKKLHVALERLTPEGMLDGLTAPLHPGAAKYFREMGLLAEDG